MAYPPSIYIHFHTLGSGGDCLQQFFTYAREEMDDCGLAWLGTSPEKKMWVENHQYIFFNLIQAHKHHKQLPIQATAALTAWKKAVATGKNLLLSYRPSKLIPSLKDLIAVLKSCPELATCPIKVFLALGRHDFALEQAFIYSGASAQHVESILGYGTYIATLQMARLLLGAENVRIVLFSGLPNKINLEAFSNLRKEFLEFCGLPQHVGVTFKPAYLELEFSRQLYHLMQELTNTYNKLEMELLFAALCQAEQCLNLPSTWLAPIEQRQKLFDRFVQDWQQVSLQQASDTALHIFSEPANNSPARHGEKDLLLAALPAELRKQLVRYLRTQYPQMDAAQQNLTSAFAQPALSAVCCGYKPSLSVLTLAYNQRQYVTDCIKGVLNQQCNFPVEHIIVDDGSTDGTREIIAEFAAQYGNITPIFPEKKTNKGKNVSALFQQCRSKYAALCDGDDYFTDPLKLQKQVDFLENNPDCALCFHPVDVIYDNGSPPRVYPPEECLPGGAREFYTIKDLLCNNFIQTNSVVYRWRFREGLPDWFQPNLVPGDIYWHLLHAETGSIGYLPGHMSVYRRHAASLYASAEVGHVEHRRQHGLNELRTYQECNKHFRGRYYKDFFWLAVGVFTDFMHVYINTGDDSLLQKGAEVAPDFARDFLAQLSLQGKE